MLVAIKEGSKKRKLLKENLNSRFFVASGIPIGYF